MLLHLCPRFFGPFRNVALVDFRLEALGLRLVGGEDLTARRPWPNKRVAVACRKQGQKAINGFLIETDKPLPVFETVTRWAVELDGVADIVITHSTSYRVLDGDFDTASENMLLWCGTYGGRWSNRWPESMKGLAPVNVEPVMELLPEKERLGTVDRVMPETGWILERRQSFCMPTIERGRLTDYMDGDGGDRLPAPASAFWCALPAALPKGNEFHA